MQLGKIAYVFIPPFPRKEGNNSGKILTSCQQ